MKILLYNISKDTNSTALPSGEAVDLTGNLRVPSSVENPVIEIEAITLPNYNYAYIPEFRRYYWINNRGCSTNKMFVLSMSVDPLATFAGDIGASTQYVLRAADEFDGAITDMLYPTKNAWTEYKTEYNSPFNLDIDDCYWCVGIKGSGATNFYLFKPNGIDAFFEYLLKPGAGGYTEDALGNLSLALDSEAAVVVDPLQYISSVTCIPVDVGLDFVAGELITIGYVQDKFFYNCVKMDITSAQIATFSYTAPGHPDVARGTYLNNAPYASYYAYVPGFGKIDLDPSIVANNTITMTLRLDYRHGDCLLTVSAGDAGIITRLTTSIGIPFEFSQVIAKGTSALTAANMSGGIVSNILSGNVEGAIGGATSAVKSAIENAIPSANSIGSNGSFAAISGAKVQFVARYARPVAEDNDHRGRPLCAKRKISSLSGYIMCADAHMHPEGATMAEISAIESAMNSGFYYESEAPAPSPAIIERLNVTANGTYNAPAGVDGYSPVVVNVPQGITPSGTLPITENGTYDVTEYASANVVVPQGITPTGNINITDTNVTNVTNYATAQVVDADLVAENIKKDVNILGIVGTFEGGSEGIDVKSAARCEIVTINVNTVTNPVDAVSYFGLSSPYTGFAIILLDSPTTQNQLGVVMSKPSATALFWWRWRDNNFNWPSTFNNSWDTRLVEGSKYLIIEW